MSESGPDPGFHVRDRRGRAEDPMSLPEAARTPEPTKAQTPPASPREPTLVGLFMMLASVAAAALEEAPGAGGGQAKRDLRQAAELIDILRLLREKTDGRRTPEETKVLDEIIYGLQVRYVEATRRPG